MDSTNKVVWTNKAVRQARKLPPQNAKRIHAAVSDLAHMPNVANIKRLSDHRYGYRQRVGNYRILFSWDGGIKIVEIHEVKKRDGNTY